MRLGPFEIRRRTTAAAAQPQLPPPHADEAGASGTILLNGFLQTDEYNADLIWPANLPVYDRMQRSDGSVQEALEHIFSPVKNATWTIQPASNEELDLEIAEFVRRCYFDWLEQPWIELLDQTLDYLTFGYQIFEVTEKIVEAELRFSPPNARAGEEITRPSRQFLVYKRWGDIAPRTVWRWNVQDRELVSIVQQALKDGAWQTMTIDAADLVVFTAKKRGDDFTGRSILRAAYKPWTMKELIEKIDAMAVERHGVGLPVAYVPKSRTEDSQLAARMEAILKNIRSGAFSYVVMPGAKQQSGPDGQEGYLLEILSPAGQLPDMSGRLNYHRAEIKAAVLARFAELGHAGVGARATGDVQSQVWYDALHAVARYIGEAHDPRIRRLVDANYAGAARYPTLVAYDLEAKDLQVFAMGVAQLVSSGAVNPDRPFREFVRDTIDAPKEDDTGMDETSTGEGQDAVPQDAAPTDEQGNPIEHDNPPPAGGAPAKE